MTSLINHPMSRGRVTPGRSRCQEEQAEAVRDWNNRKKNMDQNGLYVNAIFNKDTVTHAFIDSGCLCYMTVSSKFAKKAGLQRISITRRRLQQVAGIQDQAIAEVAYGNLDIDGHQQDRVFAYVIPDQSEDVMLGLPWIRSEDVRIKTKKGYIEIRSTGTRAKLRNPTDRRIDPKIRHCLSWVMYGLISRARKKSTHSTMVFAVSLADIEKALKPKKRSDPKEKLPLQYHEFLDAFNRQRADQLPPHRPGVDHAIEILKDDHGREESYHGDRSTACREKN